MKIQRYFYNKADEDKAVPSEKGWRWKYNFTFSQPWQKVEVRPGDLSIGQQFPEPTDYEIMWAPIPV